MKDAFICHASEDKGLARSLWLRLSQYGVTAWLDEAEMNPGDILVEKLASAIHTSEWFVVLLTPNSVAKQWVTFELNQAMDREVRGGRNFIIPVVADDCEVPLYLRNKLYVDIRQRTDYDRGVASLIRTVRGDTHQIPPDYVELGNDETTQENLLCLPRSQFALETCLRKEAYIARTVRTLGAMANLLPKQVITYCEHAPYILACPTIDAAGEIYYGLRTRIGERYQSPEHYANEMALYLESLRRHASPTYTLAEVSYFLGFHAKT